MSTIDKLITDLAAEKKAANKRAEEAGVEACNQARKDTAEKLGSLWDELSPYVTSNEGTYTRDGSAKVVIKVNPAALQLDEFSIIANYHPPKSSGQKGNTSIWLKGQTQAEVIEGYVPDFLTKQRTRFMEQQESAKKHALSVKMDEHRRAFDDWHNEDREKAQEAYLALLELAPDKTEEWDRLYAHWLKETEKRAEHKRAVKGYTQAYRKYYSAYRDALARNNALLAEVVQPTFDQPYKVREIKYALLAESELGEHMVDTRREWIMSVSFHGFDMPVTLTSLLSRTYKHIVWVSGELEYWPHERHCTTGNVYVPQADEHLYFSPWMKAESANELLALQPWIALPTKPALPDELVSWGSDRHQIERQVEEEYESTLGTGKDKE